MTLQEFKAWFEGFTESMAGVPSAGQWERIKARVDEIDGIAITQPVYLTRYVWNDWQPWQPSYPWNITYGGTLDTNTLPFDSVQAMYSAGLAEAQEGAQS